MENEGIIEVDAAGKEPIDKALEMINAIVAVSYTHLDVYKRQVATNHYL